jgi:NAD(P)-dependent dehydrogenase (short-subunit alcohol dehydrogenase family)
MEVRHAGVLITGAGSGLGLATARHFTSLGARVVAADINEAALGRLLAEQVVELAVTCNLTSSPDVADAVHRAAEIAPLRAVINCAGGGSGPQRILSRSLKMTDLEEWRSVIDLNLIGALDVSRQAALAMAENEPEAGVRGVLIHVSSIAALDGSLGVSSYSASKGALVPLVQTMARDLAPWGIRAMAIAPGVFDTPMYASLPDPIKEQRTRDFVAPARAGEPREFAMLAEHVVRNDYLNAECIRIDGGRRMHE